jgi:hypothetical protein
LIPELAKWLVEQGKVSPGSMDDALQHRELYGGGLDTALLELGLCQEQTLSEALCAVYRLPPVTPELLAGRDARVLNLFPPRLAEKYRLVPVRVAGRALQVLVCERPHPLVQEEISFLLSLEVKPFLVTEARLMGFLNQWCGVALAARYQTLLEKLGPLFREPEPPPESAPAQPLEVSEEQVEKLQQSLEQKASEQSRPPPAPAERLPLGAALEQLERAGERDEVVELLLRFAGQVSPFLALLVVRGGFIMGWDGLGSEEEVARIKRFRLPFGMASILSTVVLSRSVYLGPVSPSVGNNEMLQALGRKRPHTVFVIPITIGNHLVALLYGDAREKPLSADRLSELVTFCSRLSEAFRRLIIRRKQEARPLYYPAAGLPAPAEPPAPQPAASEPPPRLVVETPVVIEPLELKAAAAQPPAPSEPVTPQPTAAGPEAPAPGAPEPPPASTPEADAGEAAYGLQATLQVAEPASSKPQPATPADAPAARMETPPPARAAFPDSVVPEIPPRPQASQISLPHVERLAEQLTSANLEVASLAADALVAIGPEALPHIMKRFPGRLLLDPRTNRERQPPLAEHSQLLRCLLELGGEQAARAVAEKLADPQPQVRYYAVRFLGEVTLPALVPRISHLLTDSDLWVRLAAVDTLQQYRRSEEFERLLAALRRQLEEGTAEVQALSAALLGNFKDRQAIPLLAERVKARDKMLARAAREALIYITKQDFGGSTRKWLSWWQAHRKESRVLWLIRGLESSNRDIRFTAARELQQITGEYFGYLFDSDRRARRQAVERWQQWWKQEGQFLQIND